MSHNSHAVNVNHSTQHTNCSAVCGSVAVDEFSDSGNIQEAAGLSVRQRPGLPCYYADLNKDRSLVELSVSTSRS